MRYVSSILSYIHNVRYVEIFLPTFGYISADSGTFGIPAQLDIFMCIMAYSELMAYSDIFRTVDIFSQFQARYLGIAHILTFI